MANKITDIRLQHVYAEGTIHYFTIDKHFWLFNNKELFPLIEVNNYVNGVHYFTNPKLMYGDDEDISLLYGTINKFDIILNNNNSNLYVRTGNDTYLNYHLPPFKLHSSPEYPKVGMETENLLNIATNVVAISEDEVFDMFQIENEKKILQHKKSVFESHIYNEKEYLVNKSGHVFEFKTQKEHDNFIYISLGTKVGQLIDNKIQFDNPNNDFIIDIDDVSNNNENTTPSYDEMGYMIEIKRLKEENNRLKEENDRIYSNLENCVPIESTYEQINKNLEEENINLKKENERLGEQLNSVMSEIKNIQTLLDF